MGMCGCFSPGQGPDGPGPSSAAPHELVTPPPPRPPPAFATDDTKDILVKISQAHPPVEATRTMATINAQSQRSTDFDAELGAGGGRLFPPGGFVRASSLQALSRDALRRSVSDRGVLNGTPNGRSPVLGGDAWTRSQAELEKAIHAEKARDHADWNPDLQSEEQRLRKRLAKLNLDMKFRAVSFGLYGSQEYHQSIREAAVAHMRARKGEYADFVGESGVDEYLAQMALAGTWGDELTLRAISDYFGLVIYVVTSDQHNWFMRYRPPQVKLLQDVFLTYIAPVHYNAIRRQTVSLQLRQSLGRSTSIEREVRRAISHDMLKSRLSAPPAEPRPLSPLSLAGRQPPQEPTAAAAHQHDPAMAPVAEGEHEGRLSVGGSPPGRQRTADRGAPPDFFYGGPVAPPGQDVLFQNPLLASEEEMGAPVSPFANSGAAAPPPPQQASLI